VRPTVFLDFDDTLVSTCQLYRQAHWAAASLIADATLVGARTVGARIDRIDRENAAALGFGKDRFPNSLVEAYRSYAKEYPDFTPSPYLENALRAIGYAVYETEAPKFPDVEEALGTLQRTHDIILVTKGDEGVQWKRIHESGLRPYFDAIAVVPTKGAQVYRELLSCHGLHADEVTMIGDSMASDINPALEVGMDAIQVVYGTADWVFEQAEAIGHYSRTGSLTGAVNIVQLELAALEAALAAGVTP
jgi:putative hydrolase of the HAD superfamily